MSNASRAAAVESASVEHEHDPLASTLGAVADTGAASWDQAVEYVSQIAAVIRHDYGRGAEAKFRHAIRAVEMPSDGSICICLDEHTSTSIVKMMKKAMASIEGRVHLH